MLCLGICVLLVAQGGPPAVRAPLTALERHATQQAGGLLPTHKSCARLLLHGVKLVLGGALHSSGPAAF